MIIWSGWGLLTIISLILGAIAGTLLSIGGSGIFGPVVAIFVPALIFSCAAVINGLFTKWLNRGEERHLIDPKTNEVFIQKRGGSFFFIPLKAYTYIYALIALVLWVMGGLASVSTDMTGVTEAHKERFESASDLADNRSAENTGNSLDAARSAQKFQTLAVTLDRETFDRNSVQMSEKNFTTYCRASGANVLFITHVNDLSDYKESETRNALYNNCWKSAHRSISSNMKTAGATDLAVCLQDGVTSRVISGLIGERYSVRSGFSAELTLFKYFEEDAEEDAKVFTAGDTTEADETTESPEADTTVSEAIPETQPEPEPAEETTTPAPNSPPAEKVTPPSSPVTNKPETVEPNMPAAVKPEPEAPLEDLTKIRTWKASDGKTMEARLIELKGNTAVFQKEDGNTYNVPLSRLSEEDIELIRNNQ
ncbi:MAG: SHD1 domain-containing protein [Verrucomicrobiales bacterium]|nr:SHD1 domain-containing protein [Verrucomicrobiales bacterium]